VTVEFGPSRSKRFEKALAEARSGAGECSELVRHWRATEVYEDDEPVSAYHAREMAWCASSQLKSFGDCRFRFYHGIFPRCSLCPLFDAERAIRDVLGENSPPGMVFEITLGPNLRALLRGELPPTLAEGSDPGWQVPDFPPEEWGESAAEGEESSG